MAETGIARLISDSRFLSEDSLLNSMSVIALCAEAASSSTTTNAADSTWLTFFDQTIAKQQQNQAVIRDPVLAILAENLQAIKSFVPRCSAASGSWLEVVLVEMSMRNRDRFLLLWPILDTHYRSALIAATTVNYINERSSSVFLSLPLRRSNPFTICMRFIQASYWIVQNRFAHVVP